MTPNSDGPAETRERILRAALTGFMQHGYNHTTMDDIANASGTSKGTLYWHFESKEDLLESALRWFFEDDFMEATVTALDEAPTAIAKLESLARILAEAGEWAKGLFNLYLEYWASSPDREQASDLWMEMLVSYKDLIAGVIEEGVERGELRPVDADGLTWALLAAYDGLAAYNMLKPDLDLQTIHNAFFDTLLRGLEPEK
jgi:AcrR family transcriptional regulator